jgi:hypothetical protein
MEFHATYLLTLWTVNDVTEKDPEGSLQLPWGQFISKDPSIAVN